MKTTSKIGPWAALLVICSGCAHTGHVDTETEREDHHRTRNTLIAVGTAIAVGAILVNQAENNTRDAVRDAGQD